jgi:hypothetical protein
MLRIVSLQSAQKKRVVLQKVPDAIEGKKLRKKSRKILLEYKRHIPLQPQSKGDGKQSHKDL